MKAYHELDVVAAAQAIRAGEVTAEALTEALLARAQAHADLNAFTALDADQVRQAARAADRQRQAGGTLGPLHGVPIALKDNINTTALPTTAGTPALRQHRPKRNAPVAQALFDAGAILFGKTGMHELAFGITSNNGAFGAIRNPYDPTRIPGGSSGGSGAVVGARLVPASLGSDTGGSVRVPAAFCGAFGFRPSLLRWAQDGIVPISTTRDTAGPLARRAADLALIDSVVTGETPVSVPASLKGLRVGVPRTYFWEDIDSETRRLCEAALATMKEAGAVLIEADLPDVQALDEAVGFSVALYEVHRDLDRYLEKEGLNIRFADIVAGAASPDVKGILGSVLDPATAVPEAIYREARDTHRPRLIEAYRSYFAAGIDVMAFPTTPLPAPPLGEDETITLNGRAVPTFITVVRNTGPSSNAGIPGVSIPVGLTAAGLPVGLELDAAAGRDCDLLACALALDTLLPPLPAPSR
ncbi:indoleacetamide hydrolase [Bradyrhizobium sp. 2TAF24]|uniref:indoleacetamide hydrolase n=1 Tax=Bradyrhizobium sp. 2TAF24 TaxID=3233011 RepID=UPI003F91AC87